jgi:hypothetical protein
VTLRRFSSGEVAFLIGVPLLWGALLFHPTGDEYYPTVKDHVTRWQVVHIGTMMFVPLMAGVVFVLLRDMRGRLAKVSRLALLPFALFYTAWEVLVGIGTGLLVADVNALPAAERATGVHLIDEYVDSQLNAVFSAIGSAAWVVAIAAASIALYRQARGRRSALTVLLLLLSAPLIAIHVTPFGPVGLALFIAAVLLVVRRGAVSPVPAPAPLAQPGGA